MLTKKFCKIRLGLHNSPSVHLLIPLSFSSNTKTAPLRIRCFRSSSFNLRRIFGMCPRLAASNSSSASCVEALFDPRRLIRRNLHAVNASSDSHVPLPAALCDAILRREHGRLGTLRGCLHCCKDQRALHPENLVWGAIIVTAIRRWMRRAGTESRVGMLARRENGCDRLQWRAIRDVLLDKRDDDEDARAGKFEGEARTPAS